MTRSQSFFSQCFFSQCSFSQCSFALIAFTVSFALLGAPRAVANDASKAASSKKADPKTKAASVDIDPVNFDLLPMHPVERGAIFLDNEDVLNRASILHRRAKKTRENLAKRKNQNDDGSKKLRAQLKKLRKEAAPVLGKVVDICSAFEFDKTCLKLLQDVPRGPHRVMRYAHRTVLSVESLSPKQRELLAQVIEQIDGATLALHEQKKRQRLKLKQLKTDRSVTNEILRTFDRQVYDMDKRFWRLVDYVLTDEQRSVVYGRLPGAYRQRSQLIEHLYRTPNLTPKQSARLTALLTEMEAEASPDRAAQKRLGAELKNKKLSKADRQAIQRELRDTNRRLTELVRFGYLETKKVFTDEQWMYYRSIPPKINVGERAQRMDRVLTGYNPSAKVRKQLRALKKSVQARRKAAYNRVNEIRKMGADYGPDSPQMMSMMTMMAGATGDADAASREAIGRAFLEVIPEEDTTRWVLSVFGR